MKTHQESVPYSVLLGEKGRVVLPAEVRENLGLETGDRLLLAIDPDGALRLTSARRAAARLKGMFAHLAPGRSLVDELLEERRREAEEEERDASGG